ncbi:MAG: O-sialoglycoprotein endopeptidase [Bacillota bacterium]|uniref:N(6)-L-threonylcarbamoyladenine synthase n=1 Tax=Thermanaerosceptrum fracticalcis TaxID=1712410 RepID=A0A7G6E0D2_THEFR|nr:O-sialoglycoprotein endopeptidase [Thermanaerosceptrum fracticalcis]QNB45536.1 O-sialoglycoprotein endopeptidase [Thermanaerosceptrum fracticalcis]
MDIYLGVDTSCYTTSLAIVDHEGNLLRDLRKLLPVPKGQQGLRQSAALFQHLKNLPELTYNLFENIPVRDIKAIGVSSRPRPREDSYMPVFTAGLSFAESFANLLKVPLFKTSHQEGHVKAGLWSAKAEDWDSFLVVHLSGGTTEFLAVQAQRENPGEYLVETLGASLDIHAGQLIDRVGVAMGLPFPAGPHLEKLAAQCGEKHEIMIPSYVKGYNVSFSGAETMAKKMLQKRETPAAVARAVEHCIALSLEKIIRSALRELKTTRVLLVGGVAANQYIRERLKTRLQHPAVGAELYFPEPKYSSDNAVGVSLIARDRSKN